MLSILLMLLMQLVAIIAIIAIFIIITINGSDGTLCAAVVERVGRRICSQGRCGCDQGRPSGSWNPCIEHGQRKIMEKIDKTEKIHVVRKSVQKSTKGPL